MMVYDKIQKNCEYGHFNPDSPAGYTLTDGDKLKGPWYYVYNNRKLLLYVDQNGPVKVQYQPPNGILIIKRELGENQSKWQVWVQSPDLNSGVPVSNFNTPSLRYDFKKPEFSVEWTPEKAFYTAKYDTVDIITEIFMPYDKATVSMKTTIVNKSDKGMDFTATPSLFPYVNIPQMVAWDLPEWYLDTQVKFSDEMLTIHGHMRDPLMDKLAERSVTFNMDYDGEAELELDMSLFGGAGNFLSPDCVKEGYSMSQKMKEAEGSTFGSHQTVWAARYAFSLQPGESKTFTQVLTVQEDLIYSEEENQFEKVYFNPELYAKRVAETEDFYRDLFTKRTVKTDNPLYDNFINCFAPLQMSWVCSLDRGWPSCMRGIRDASQDFTGMTPLDPVWTKETILAMFEHQQVDGWMPRQISTVSRTAPHDMRYYCDGGAFLLELINEYMTFTRDTSLMEEMVYWLDSDEKSTVLDHVKRCVQFYLDEHNIGEHGLCKVWYGDWWDPMDKIGMEGRGESVTVTAQMILALENMAKLYRWLNAQGKADDSILTLADNYLSAREKFLAAMKNEAFNALGYFNGYFNDNGKWLLSDCDPDGEERLYLVANAWALIAGCADKEMQESVISNIESRNFGTRGYNTNSKGFAKPVEKAGRVGLGSGASPYNHAQSFYVRACCEAGRPDLAYKATRYILPFEEEYAPVAKTYAPPFSIANGYSNGKRFMHRVQFQYLSGTVSYVLRTVYNFFSGITYGYDGLTLKPCIPAEFGDFTVRFTYLGKNFTVNFKQTEKAEKTVLFNGKEWATKINENSGRPVAFFKDEDMIAENIVEFEY
ncbi:MAG: hypothetical protein II997_02340 [Clostridia bacterium]|nr:hypothetical protein [Clostridia bacterium]